MLGYPARPTVVGAYGPGVPKTTVPWLRELVAPATESVPALRR